LYQKEKGKEGKSEIFDLISWCKFLRPKWENKQRPDYNNNKKKTLLYRRERKKQPLAICLKRREVCQL